MPLHTGVIYICASTGVQFICSLIFSIFLHIMDIVIFIGCVLLSLPSALQIKVYKSPACVYFFCTHRCFYRYPGQSSPVRAPATRQT